MFVLTLVDLFINATADHSDSHASGDYTPLAFIGAQLLIQLLNFLMVFMLFFGTYLFQVGLIGVLVKEFRGILWAVPTYAVVYIGYAACKIVLLIRDNKSPVQLWDSSAFIVLSIVQKFGACGRRTAVVAGPRLAGGRVASRRPFTAPARPPLACTHRWLAAVALFYYYMVLRTTARIGEARWYQRGPWVARFAVPLDNAAATGMYGNNTWAQGAARGPHDTLANVLDGGDDDAAARFKQQQQPQPLSQAATVPAGGSTLRPRGGGASGLPSAGAHA